MSSSSGIRAIRQARRKKSSLSEVKIAVVGAPGVGKSGERPEVTQVFSPPMQCQALFRKLQLAAQSDLYLLSDNLTII